VAAELGIIGIGNPLAGDDGVGVYVADAVLKTKGPSTAIFFRCLENDLLEIADYLFCARHFLFVDAFVGNPAGQLRTFGEHDGVLMPSLHQTDIGSVMNMLRPLGLVDPFPTWEIRAISVAPPLQLGYGLSAPVKAAAEKLIDELCRL
jgi:hydrogenase maturation protease